MRGAVIPEVSNKTSIPNSNHGEGDPEAAKRFNEAETRFVESARGKQRVLDGAKVRPGEEAELKEAERLGKERAKGAKAPLPVARPPNR